MQNDKYTEFDLELRRMLGEAEEEVPSHIWAAVSGELDRRDRRKLAARRWRRAAAGFVAAAAVLSGIFVFLGRSPEAEPVKTASIPSAPAVAVPQDDIPDIMEQIAATQGVLADVPGRVVRSQASGSVPSEVVPADTFAPVKETAVEPVAEPAAEPQEAPAAAPETAGPARTPSVRPADNDARTAVTGTLDDPFAWPEEDEPAARKHAPSFVVAGNAMTNDFTGTGLKQIKAPTANVRTTTGVVEKGSSNYSIPVTFGLGVRFGLSERWSLGTGINWSHLSRSFNGVYTNVEEQININSEIVNDLHYIGVPLNLYYNIFDSRRLLFYAWAGGTGEKGIVNRFRIQKDSGDIFYKEGVDGLQWSAAAGLGLEFKLGDHFGLYLDPSARYYFDCGQPASIRTKRPFMMNYEVGLRFNL